VWQRVTYRFRRHRRFSLVVIAEGARPTGGDYAISEVRADPSGLPVLGGAGIRLRHELETITRAEQARAEAAGDFSDDAPEIRVVVLGHIQRGGTPLAADRIIASACGSHAVDMLVAGHVGHMAAWRSGGPTHVPLDVATVPHLIDPEEDALVTVAREMGICLGDACDLVFGAEE
jgi:6-phosphofructokinase 1